MLKKGLMILMVSIFAIVAFASMDAFALGENNKIPFELIWQKLVDHEERIKNIEEQPPLPGIEVYGNDDRFIGILLSAGGYSGDYMEIYDPTIKRVVNILTSTGDVGGNTIFYKTTDCSGQPYSGSSYANRLYKNNGKYYIGQKVEPTEIIAKSIKIDERECSQSNYTKIAVPLDEVNKPDNIPVALPVYFEQSR